MAEGSQKALQGRLALVTGCTSGIGLGIARGLARRGCDVILNGFGEEDHINALKKEFSNEHGVEATHLNVDLSKSPEVESMCDHLTQSYPSGIDILVNNAGFQHVSPVEEFPQEKWDAMLAVMLTTPFQLIKHLVPAMKSKGWGRIVNVSSAHGHIASPNKAGYVSVKHGLIGLTKVVALETAGTGVTCNAICPGYVDTPILQAQVQTLSETRGISYEEAKIEFLSKFHASGAPVGVDQLADTVVFMCSDAASQMTGSSIILDGGWTAH